MHACVWVSVCTCDVCSVYVCVRVVCYVSVCECVCAALHVVFRLLALCLFLVDYSTFNYICLCLLYIWHND